MKKDLERLIGEFLDAHPDATLYIRRDLMHDYEVGVMGENHTHGSTIAEGVRRYWGGVGLAQPACSMEEA